MKKIRWGMLLGSMLMSPIAGSGQDIAWMRQFGSPSLDSTLAVSVHSSGVYAAGSTYGVLPGQSGFGRLDALVRKYDFSGNEVWTRQFGTDRSDGSQAVAATDAGVYVGGATSGQFPGQSSAGGRDAFVRKYDTDGNEVWTCQFGTASGDTVVAVAGHATGVYALGITYGTFPGQLYAGGQDMFLAKLNDNGGLVWVVEFGTPGDDLCNALGGIAVDETGVYVAGQVAAALPSQAWNALARNGWGDAFIRKYDFDGNEVWTREYGTACGTSAIAVAAHATGVYVVGVTQGDFRDPTTCSPMVPQGRDTTGYVRKYDVDGNAVWTRQIGGQGPGFLDYAEAIAVDDSGVYVGGVDLGTLAGQSKGGPNSDKSACEHVDIFDQGDVYVRKYDFDGQVVWTRQFGSVRADYIHGIGVNETGVYAAGFTHCSLPGQTSAGDVDAFVVKLSRTPTSLQGQIQLIVGQVETLLDDGVLNSGQGNSLSKTLSAAVEQLDQGDAAAKGQLQAFIGKVVAYQKSSVLTSAQAQALIESAGAVLGQL